jgi:hypothetical protein
VLIQSIAILAASVIAVPGIARVSQRDFEDFETCYGSYEGASSVLPMLRERMPPADFVAVERAMRDLGEDFVDLERRLSDVVRAADHDALTQAHMIGRVPWTNPQNQTLAYWSRNAPMSVACFALTKRLHEELPSGF